MPAHLLRSAVLTGYAEVARSLGLDPPRMLDLVGLPPACLSDPESRISAEAASRLLEVSAAAAGVEDFALRLLSTRQLSLLGPVGLLVREQPTVAKALEAIRRYVRLHNEAVFVRLEPADDLHILEVGLILDRQAGARQGTELLVGAGHRILRALLGEGWRAEAVCFSHGRPADLASHHRAFGPVVEFGHEFDGILLTAADLARPLPNADPLMAAHLARYIDEVAATTAESGADVVRQLVQGLLASGRCSAAEVAKRLGIDRRTLHNRLAREGLSFTAVLDETRSRLAVAHLETSRRSIAEIAELLGFSATSAFTRWFGVQFGTSPSAWRGAKEVARER